MRQSAVTEGIWQLQVRRVYTQSAPHPSMGSLSDSTAVSLPKAQVDVEVGSQARRSVEGDGIGSGSGIGSELSGQEEEEEYERVGKARVHDEGSGLVPIPKKSRLIKTDRPRPFICGICTRGFARQEHLKRHERSHTNEKPFLCAFCGRCFARRDLVLRHQQKLHAALMDQDKNPDICSASKEMKQHYAERHIIRKPGNKETMLPTPGSQAAAAHEAAAHDATSGSDGSHQGDENGRALKDESPSLLQQQPKKRKRHASFSASTNVSYTQNKDVPQIIKGEMNGIPHQVGFSTPQLTAQELVDKALLSGIDVDSLMPPEFLLSDPSIPLNATNLFNGHLAQQALAVRDKHSLNGTNSSSTPHLLDSFSKTDQMHIDLDQVSKDFHQKQQFPPGLTPLISDLLTMRSSNAGVGGFVDLSVEQNLDYFNYKGSPKGSKRAKANKFGILEQPAPALEPVHNVPIDSNHENTSDLIHQFINNMESHDSDVNSRPANRDNSPMSVATRGGLLHDQQDNQQHHNPEEEHWLSEFINTEMDGNFKVNMSHFNEIGFPTTSASSQINSDPNSPVISQLSSNVNAVHRNQIPLRQKQSQVQSQPPQQQSFAGTYSMNSPMLVQNGSGSGSGSGSCSFNQSSSQTGTPLDISSLFKSRQVDLFKKIMDTNGISTPGISPNSVSNGLKPRKGTRLVFFDEALREKILSENNLLSTQFPTLQELNVYANLYQDEFHKYFPFIHLHSIKPSMEIYPLLLSICVIGALYGFHSSHAMLLFNITRFHIREYLERTKDYHDKTPLWVIQSMVLLIFLGIFNNDMTITQTMNTQIMSLIELVKLKQLNLPLENIMPLPIESDHIMEYQDNPELQDKIRKTYRTKEQMERNFQYFIKAQSRIRTCHTILIISNLFTSLVGLDCCFHSIDLKCGIPCHNEQLYLCENSAEWSEILMNDHVELDSKFSLIQLSNGGETYKNCLIYLTNGHQFFYDNKKVSFKTLLSLLISIHEKIFIERYNLKRETNIQIIEMKWRLTSRPIIESLLKFWEASFVSEKWWDLATQRF